MNEVKIVQSQDDVEIDMTFDIEAFEQSADKSSGCYWDAREFMNTLDYGSWESFLSVMRKAMASCTRADLMPDDNFIRQDTILEDGSPQVNYRLTRFACLLIAMHADDKKDAVSKAKVSLSAIVDAVASISENDLGRLEVRNDLKAAELSMTGAAQAAGVMHGEYGIFKDAGFRGMYNMSLSQLKQHKGIDQKLTAYNFMGLTELAGNLFRVTQTAERIKNSDGVGINHVSETARAVGKEVRDMMIKNSGTTPESLPVESNVDDVKRGIKKVAKEMAKIDSPKPKKKTK